MKQAVVTVTDVTFEQEVLKENLPVVVDFWAEWCGPCKMFAPVFTQCAEKLLGKVKFCKLNVDENRNTANRYGVQGIPTVILFKDGKEIGRKVGMIGEIVLRSFLEKKTA